MTDPTDSPEHEAVRRLLADARYEGPTPPEVVSRLEDTLASLVAERSAEATAHETHETPKATDTAGAPVVDLAARRRRRAGVGVLAAAAVVVAGVALGQVVPGMGGPGTSSESSASSDAGAARDAQAESAQPAPSDSTALQAPSGDTSASQGPEESSNGTPETLSARGTTRLSTTDPDLTDRLIALRSAPRGTTLARESADAGAACGLTGLGRGRRVYADVDGLAGLVLFRHRDGSQQQVELYQCGAPTPVQTVTLPAR